jgi:probable HAF family extracellular repeat protein
VKSCAAASLTVLCAWPALADPPRFTIKDITPGFPEPGAGALVINNAGQVAGFWSDDLAFVYDDRDGSSVSISQNAYLPTDINEAGAVIGFSDQAQVFLLENGGLTQILFDDLRDAFTGGLNDAGTVVGWAVNPSISGGLQPFIYSGDKPQLLDLGVDQGSCLRSEAHDINNAGQIVGRVQVPTPSGCTLRAFLHQDGETVLIGDLFPDRESTAPRINEAGEVIVNVPSTSRDAVDGRAYVYSDGELEQIIDDQASASGLNNFGWVVGSFGPREESRPFLYADGEFYALNDLVQDLTGFEFVRAAVDVNDSGQIAGSALRSDGQRAAILLTPLDVFVKLDVRPHHAGNRIDMRAKGRLIAVAVLSTDSFDATQVDWQTVEFGPNEAREHHQQIHVKDVDRDGDMDAVLHFRIRDTGIRCVTRHVTLTGKTFSGDSFRGTDRIEPVNCRKKKWEPASQAR